QLKVLPGIFAAKLIEMWNALHTRPAPGRPELQQGHFSFQARERQRGFEVYPVFSGDFWSGFANIWHFHFLAVWQGNVVPTFRDFRGINFAPLGQSVIMVFGKRNVVAVVVLLASFVTCR